MPKLEWKLAKGRFTVWRELRAGSVLVGKVFAPIGSKGEPTKYRAECLLPCIFLKEPDAPGEAEAMEKLERAVKAWFDWVYNA